MHTGQGEEEHDATTRDRQGTGPSVEDGNGGEPASVRLREEGRRSKVPSDGITLGPIGTWAQVEDRKKGATARGKSRTGSI